MARMGLNVPVATRLWLRRKAAEMDTDMSKLVSEILQHVIDEEKRQSNSEGS